MADGETGHMSSKPGDMPPTTETRSKTQLKHLIEGEVFTALKRHFFMKGKGRRPDVPSISKLTNGLLLQLFFLKEEADASYKELKTWLEKLLPCTSTVSESRIYHRVSTLLDLSSHMPEDELCQILQAEHDFNALPQVLVSLGMTSIDPDTYDVAPLEDITNDVVVTLSHLASRESKSAIFVRKWLVRLSLACADMSDSRLKTCIANCLNKYKQLKKNKKVKEVESFLNSMFVVKKESQQSFEQNEKGSAKVLLGPAGEANSESEIKLNNKVKKVQEKKTAASTCFICEEKEDIIREKNNKIKELERKVRILEWEKVMSNKREKGLEADLNKIQQTKLYYKRNKSLKEGNDLLSNEITKLKEQLQETNSAVNGDEIKQQSLKRKIKSEQTMKSKYRKKMMKLGEERENILYALNDIKDDPIVLKENHHNLYSNHVRQLYMALQGEANVASTQATKVVMLVSKYLFNKEFKEHELPCPRTCLNFMYEGNHIAKQHIIERMLHSNYFTYGSDGTGREKQHFLEHHLILDDGATLSLGFSEVPNDKANTLLEKSLDLFDELTDVYCDLNSTVDRNRIFKNVLSKLRCLMSDRAANMKLFNKKLLQFKKDLIGQDASIEFLHCNAHFLIALSDVSEKALKEIEKSQGKLGRDNDSSFNRFASNNETAACRVIRLTANVLGPRGDEKNGCRQEWLAHCDASGIKSTFTSYRSNRFNNLFENAIALLCHREQSIHFLENQVSHNNLLLKSICLDLHDLKIMSLVTGIALFATFITCPYWKLMNSSTPYGQFPKYVKAMKSALERWLADDFDLDHLPNEASVFGNDFRYPSQVACEHFSSPARCNKELATSTFKAICEKSLDVLTRQLSDFLDGGVYGGELPTDIQVLLDTCPLTNLTGERLFGDLDYDMTKRRTASTFLRSTISMMKHNNLSAFIDSKTPIELDAIMSSGRKQGKKLKDKHKEAKRQAKEELKAKLIENERLKKEKELQEIERRASLMTDVIAQGGICHTKEDLDLLMEKPQRMKNLKIQIRFHKYYLNAPDLKLTGNYQMLYAGLCNHLCPGINEVLPIVDSESEESGDEEESLGDY